MISTAAEGYDPCPLEGFDSKRMKKLLEFPYGAGINMVVPCGIRDGEKGIWASGTAFRSLRCTIGSDLPGKESSLHCGEGGPPVEAFRGMS